MIQTNDVDRVIAFIRQTTNFDDASIDVDVWGTNGEYEIATVEAQRGSISPTFRLDLEDDDFEKLMDVCQQVEEAGFTVTYTVEMMWPYGPPRSEPTGIGRTNDEWEVLDYIMAGVLLSFFGVMVLWMIRALTLWDIIVGVL